jgi:hypothetical protein
LRQVEFTPHHQAVRWRRRPAIEEDYINPVLGRWLMRMDGKLDEILDLLRDEDDEAESEP